MDKMISYLFRNMDALHTDVKSCEKHINRLVKHQKKSDFTIMLSSSLVCLAIYVVKEALINQETRIDDLEAKLSEVLEKKGE